MRPRINPGALALPESSRWRKGQSGNPAGRPAGSRHKLLQHLDALGDEIAINVFRRLAWEAIFNGDIKALDILARRVWPERKGRPLELSLPEIKELGDLQRAQSVITASMSRGDISPEEAQMVSAVLSAQHSAAEIAELREEVAKLKEKIDAAQPR